MKISISTDSTSDLNKELIEKYNIHVMPLVVILGEESYYDGVNIKAQDVFEYVDKKGVLPKTAARSIEEYQEFFSNIMKKDNSDALIHISLSSELSSSYNYAYIASQNLKNVYVIDSLSLSSGCGVTVMSCIDKINANMPIEQIVEEATNQIPRINASFVIDTLKYLHKGGRCSTLSLLGANILGIRPSIKVTNGKMSVDKKYMGKIETVTIKYIYDTLKDHPKVIKDRIFLTYTSTNTQLINQIEGILKEQGFKEIHKNFAGCTIASHCGEGTLGILFLDAE